MTEDQEKAELVTRDFLRAEVNVLKAEIQAMLNRQLQIMMAHDRDDRHLCDHREAMNDTEPRLDLIMEELRLIRADLENLRQRVEAIEQRHAKLDRAPDRGPAARAPAGMAAAAA